MTKIIVLFQSSKQINIFNTIVKSVNSFGGNRKNADICGVERSVHTKIPNHHF